MKEIKKRNEDIVILLTQGLFVQARAEQEIFYIALLQFHKSEESTTHGYKEHQK